jgi:hypothetical protein
MVRGTVGKGITSSDQTKNGDEFLKNKNSSSQ